MQSDLFSGDQLFPADDDLDALRGFHGYEFPNFPPPPAASSFDLKRRFETATSGVIEDDKSIIALRNHKEAEKRRRERINSHLDRLRSLLPCTSKTDKATILAKVVERVRELNKEAIETMKLGTAIPSEKDEISVQVDDSNKDELMIRACVSCEDRSELFSDLSRVVNSLRLKTVKAEICTVGGRARSVLVVSGDGCSGQQNAAFLHDALKGIVQGSSGDGFKRRRRMDLHPHLA